MGLLYDFRRYLIAQNLDFRTAANYMVPIRHVLPFMHAVDAAWNFHPEAVSLDGLLRFAYAAPPSRRRLLSTAWSLFAAFYRHQHGVELPVIPSAPLGRPASAPHPMTEHFAPLIRSLPMARRIEDRTWADVEWPTAPSLPAFIRCGPTAPIRVDPVLLDHLVVICWWASTHGYDPKRAIIPAADGSMAGTPASEIMRSRRVLQRIREGQAIAVERQWKVSQTRTNQAIKKAMLAQGYTPPAFLDDYNTLPDQHYTFSPPLPYSESKATLLAAQAEEAEREMRELAESVANLGRVAPGQPTEAGEAGEASEAPNEPPLPR